MVLGEGGFGRVTLVQHKPSKQFFALKAMLKERIVKTKMQKNIVAEKDLMRLCAGHPFIIQLFQTFKDPGRVYLLLEFVQGGNLMSLLEKGKLDEASTRFYT